MKKNLPLSKAYQLIEPGPVVLVSTIWKGRNNVMTMSWHTMLEFEPPLIGCVISEGDYSFIAVKKNKECVINVPTAKLAKKVVAIGNTSGQNIDKFAQFKLTAMPALRVKAPLIGECYAHLECKVVDTKLVNAYNFFILEVVQAWIDTGVKHPRTLHHRGYGTFAVDGSRTITLPSRMR